MKTYIEDMKATLHNLIHEMAEHYRLYVPDPGRDFSREKKLSLKKVLAILVSMGGGSLRNELIDYFHCSVNMASAFFLYSLSLPKRKVRLPDKLFCCCTYMRAVSQGGL